MRTDQDFEKEYDIEENARYDPKTIETTPTLQLYSHPSTKEDEVIANPCKHFKTRAYKLDIIEKQRTIIYNVISEKMDTKTQDIDLYRTEDLQYMVELYDQLFLGGYFKRHKPITIKIVEQSYSHPWVSAYSYYAHNNTSNRPNGQGI